MARWRSCWVCLVIRLGGGRRRRLVNKVAAEAKLPIRNGDLRGAKKGMCYREKAEMTALPIMVALTLLSSEYLSSSRRNEIRYRNTLRWQRGS